MNKSPYNANGSENGSGSERTSIPTKTPTSSAAKLSFLGASLSKDHGDASENKTTSLDLGYDSLHSTPKTQTTMTTPAVEGTSGREHRPLTGASTSTTTGVEIATENCSSSDSDEDDEDSLAFNTPRDPIRRRISTIATNDQSIIMANCLQNRKKSRSHPTKSSVRHVQKTSSSTQCRLRAAFWRLISRPTPTPTGSGASSSGGNAPNKTTSLLVVDDKNNTTTTTTLMLEPVQEDCPGFDALNNSSSPLEPEREEWGKKIDFLLSIIGFAVDLSNVWRFPYLCYKNGGGVFLIPYSIMLLFGALPLFFMELALGQFAKSGPINIWDKICPPLKGIGYCFVLISWYVSFYYNVIIAWTTNYVIKTFISGEQMPWQHCENSYNTPRCISMDDIKRLCHGDEDVEANRILCDRLSNRTSPTEEFFNLGLLQIDKSSGLDDLGHLRPELIGCLIIVFVTLYFSLFKGVKSSGKVVWVTATAPYFILTILLMRGLFLPGALSGIKYYISPRLEKLLEPNVWVDAAVQVFYSIGVGFGVHLTYASFNKFNNNCYRDCLITAAVNSLTSFYSGFVIFTYLGYMAFSMNKEIQNVASEGYGLVFQVYPEAIATLPFAKFWSVLFFIMLLTLGIDSAMGGLEAVITGLMDEFNLKWIGREKFTVIIISTSLLGSLINCTQGGAFTMVWFDTYSAGISLLCSAMFEALAVTYFYGVDRFCCDIESMIGHKPSRYFVLSWKYISPIFLSTIIIMSIMNSQRITYYGYKFPIWATVLGWCFTLSSISAIPIYAAFYFIRQRYFNRVEDCSKLACNAPIESYLRSESSALVDDINNGLQKNSTDTELMANSRQHDSVLAIKKANENSVYV